MTSFLILANHSDATAYLSTVFAKEQISLFDQIIITPDGSLGIEDIRKLQKQIAFKPYKSPQKAVVIYAAETITREAQNALLKTLEEPPAQTLIYLISEAQNAFLPTILSRCHLINLKSPEKASLDEGSFEATIIALGNGGVGECLYQAQLLATKEKALPWLITAITYFRESLLESETPQEHELLINILESFQEAHSVISATNVSPRLVMENLFLSL